VSLVIRYASSSDWEQWDEYNMTHPEGTLFHTSNWKSAIEKSFGHKSLYLLAHDGDSIVGILPLFQMKSFLFGHFLSSVPFAELGGPVTDHPDITSELLSVAEKKGQDLQCDYLELKNTAPLADLQTKELYVNFSKEILPNVEANLQAIPRKSRAAVRKGIKSGLFSEIGPHLLDEYYEIIARSFHNLGTPIFSKAFFKILLDCHPGNSQLMLIRDGEGIPVSGVLTFFFKNRVMPYFAGSRVEYRNLCPNDFMYWELLKYGCENSYEIFDYGRSKVDTGSYSFKKHWGFEPVPLAYQYQLIKADGLPNLSPTNPKYARKIEMWRRMPFGLTKFLGPSLAKHLG